MRTETILKLARATGTNYCHRDYCGCGGDPDGIYPNLLFTNVGGGSPTPSWLPSWANGSPPEDLYAWVQQEAWTNAEVAQALHEHGMRRYKKFQARSA